MVLSLYQYSIMESSKFATAAPNGSGAHDDGGAAALVRALRDPPPVRLERTNFGKDMRKWFLFPEGHRNLNNGAFSWDLFDGRRWLSA